MDSRDRETQVNNFSCFVTVQKGKHPMLGWAKLWNIVIFTHIVVHWGKIKRKSVVTAHIVQCSGAGIHLNNTGWTNQRAEIRNSPIREQKTEILLRVLAPELCTM